ncbi:MAG: glycosyltransferase family 117 protein [Sulfurihydrogenibium sp.]|uniref:glycosyltransferase family 117 protein n=1 Tax=Sulfurihydrogenibium sp. TaxID=2053621 RepID=UPI003D145BC6
MHSRIIYLLLSFISIIYIFSLFPVFSTGDGGGLVTASYLLGIAHPPGYPFYVEIGKLFTFFPVANIGIRVGIITVLFSILSLYMVYKIVYEMTKNEIYGLIAVSFLSMSYSFYYNSVVEKFYTLNLFFILVLVYFGIKVIYENNLDRRFVYISAFLLGLGFSIHHTLLFMAVPLFILGLSFGRSFLKLIPLSLMFFLTGFLVNIYLYIRSVKDSFAAAHKADTLKNFIAMILRKFYGDSSSIDATTNAFISLHSYLYTIKNLSYLFAQNFSYTFVLFLLLGFIFIFKENKKLFIFLFSAFFMYAIFLGKITFSSKNLTLQSLYVSGNQYFLPALSLFIIVSIYSFFKFFEFVKENNLKFVYKTTLPIFVVFPFTFLFGRFVETNHFNNWVPYYHAKDLLSYTPVASVVSTYGDNHTFELWYLKLVGRYRDDVCHLTSHYYNSTQWRLEGCKPKYLYQNLIPEFFKGDIENLMAKKRFLSTVALAPEHPFYNFIKVKPFLFSFFYLRKDDQTPEEWFNQLNLEKYKFLTVDVCLSHNTDDPFTFEMCNFFSNAYLVIASSIVPTLKLNKIEVDADIGYGSFLAPFRLTIYPSPQNSSFIEIYKALRAYNNMNQFYLLPEEKGVEEK